jgi:hypothetical protein
LELAEEAAAMAKVETLHSEHRVSHFLWLHTVEELLMEMVNLDLWAQEQKIEQESAQAAEVKVNGLIHGAQVAVAEALVALDTTVD